MKELNLIEFKRIKLNYKDKKMSTYNKELLVMIHEIEKWRQYILGLKLKIKIDHGSLKYLW